MRKSMELGISGSPAIAPGALQRLTDYSWPGNVRELENLVERELIRHRGGQLIFESVMSTENNREALNHQEGSSLSSPLRLDELMSLHISTVLKMTNGKIHGPGGAAELLGLEPNTLRARMDKLGVNYRRKRNAANFNRQS
jgi:DNA-binding NtrC family response regulator